MKHKKLITFSIVVVLLIALLIVITTITKEEPLGFTYNHSKETVESIKTGDYRSYQKDVGEAIVNPEGVRIEINGYDSYDGSNPTKRVNVEFTNNELILNEVSDGEYLFSYDTGNLYYEFDVPTSGYYNIKLNYLTTTSESKSSSIERKLTVIADSTKDSEYHALMNDIEFGTGKNIRIKISEDELTYAEYKKTREYRNQSLEERKAVDLQYCMELLKIDNSYTEDRIKELIRVGFINEAFDRHMANQSYVFSRVWKGDNATIKNVDNGYDNTHTILQLPKDTSGNDIKPSQVEVENQLISAYFSDYMGYITEPYQYYLSEGTNKIIITSIKECLLIKSIEVTSVEKIKTYEEYLKEFSDKGIKHEASDVVSYRIEAEANKSTSSPTLYPITDRTSANTYPHSNKNTMLNSIGGDNWKVLGDWIVWEFEVEKSGFYNISMRARQNLVRGMYSHRMVYIDDVIPFEELKSTVFSFSSDWQNVTLGSNETGEPFKFYLEKGKHEIKMEVTLGIYGELIEELENVTQELSNLYLGIIKYTTASPDPNRDYELTKKEDLNIIERLESSKARLEVLSNEIARISSKNSDLEDKVGDGEIYKDGKSDKTGVIDTMVEQLKVFLNKSSKITQQLSSFSTNISSLGTLLSTLREFPLTIDYLVVYTANHQDQENYKMKKANEGFFKSLWNSISSFYYSFVIDYSEIGTTSTENVDHLKDVEVEVWMTLGRDQANVIRKLVDNDFSKKVYKINGEDTHISVNLKLTGTDVLLKAALAGVGPDVAINVDSGLPVNYGLRHATLDLAEAFGDDYWNFVEDNFLPSTIRQFTFNGKTYAVPEKQNYMMMFVRTDIMQDLYGDEWESKVPKTWGEVRSIMTDLQTNQLQFYLPVNDAGASILNPAFVSMLYQNGGQLYSDDAKETGLLSDVAMNTFEYWTDFYTKYSFPKFASFINRFRSGEMPLGVSYYEMYNTLAVFAPEIRGNWAFYPIPGSEIVIENAENDPYKLSSTYPYTVVDHTSVASGTACIIIEKNALKDSDVKYASWEFLKWWTGEIQDEFGKEMEGILGSSARHATANYNSFVQLAWPKADQEVLLKQWGYGDHNPRNGEASSDDPNNFYLNVKNVSVPNELGVKFLNHDLYSYEVIDGKYHVYGVREIPQIAGSYITGREVENAYRAVINKNQNAKETLYSYAQNINNEIDRKRSEFNLD